MARYRMVAWRGMPSLVEAQDGDQTAGCPSPRGSRS